MRQRRTSPWSLSCTRVKVHVNVLCIRGGSEGWWSRGPLRGGDVEKVGSGETRVVRTADGRELGVCLWGDPEGAPVFWLHGTPGSRLLRDPTAGYARLQLTVCTYDRPGYGVSTRRRGRVQAQAAEDVAAIADALGWERFAVGGPSGGSGPALAAARFLANRVTRCGVIVGEGPSAAPELQQAMDEDYRRDWELAVRGDEEGLAASFENLMEWVRAGMAGLEIEDHTVRSMLEEAFTEAGRHGPAGYVDDRVAGAHDWGFAVEDVSVPTRIVGALEDTPFMRENSRWLAHHIPGSQLSWRPGGHFGPSDDVDEARLLAWLGHGTVHAPT